MKFGKSYMETLASPSFPKEWRDGAIEYKQLKKLINGVVAELESLGLGADVLRDLIVPPEGSDSSDGGNAESEEDDPIEDLDDAVIVDVDDDGSRDNGAPPIKTANGRYGRLSRRAMSGPAHRSSSHEHSMGSSADDCEECLKDLQKHKAERALHPETPAQEWVAHIAHAQHTRRGHRALSGGYERQGTRSAGDQPDPQASNGSRLRPPSAGAYKSSTDKSEASGASADDGALHSAKLNKRDLEELRRRRNSSADGRSTYRPSNVSSRKSGEDRAHDWGGHAWRERQGLQPQRTAEERAAEAAKKAPKAGPKWVKGKDGRRARAEYGLGGTSEKPIPHIRLFVESPVQSDDELSAGDEADSEGGSDEEADVSELAAAAPTATEGEDDSEDRITEISPDRRSSINAIKPLQGQPRSPILTGQANGGKAKGKRRVRIREIVIPLNADTEFLDTLTGALSNLTTLQENQRKQFEHNTEALCNSVSQAVSPYGNKNDLYAWREIFALWCELQIFESQREKDRGELSVDETEARLRKFAEELAKRGWNTEAFNMDASQRAAANAAYSSKEPGHKLSGKLAKLKPFRHGGSNSALPMKDPRSIAAFEDFLKLNLALLDVKKFQRVNVEAARKILKKHDKRTALTASSDLSRFVEQQERMRAAAASAAAGVGISGLINIPEHSVASNSAMIKAKGAATHPSLAALLPTSTSALMSSSLPHILLTLMTTTLLPILPSIDDYSCAICTGVAWRPIKLDCSHLFCIRCLVKLQKQGKNDCPLCRAKGVVGNADERNMDEDAVKFLKDWFPREVAEKDKENEKDRRKEEMLELGLALENEKCVIA